MVASVMVFCLQGWTLAVAAQWTAPSTENANSVCLCLRCVAAVLQKGAYPHMFHVYNFFYLTLMA